jgi:hypothetical protein
MSRTRETAEVGWGFRNILFLCLLSAGAAWLLNYLGAPAYLILLSFAAAWGWWTLYQEALRSRQEAARCRRKAVKCRREMIKCREVLGEAVVRVTYSVHRLLLMSSEERDLHETDDDVMPDPFQTIRVLKRFLELADEKSVDEARGFLGRMDLVQLEAWERGPREMNRQLALALAAEFKQSHPALTKPESESENSPNTSMVSDASASRSAGSPPAL